MPTALNWNHPEVQKQLAMHDVLVFQRNVLTPDVWAAMDYWRALGRVVVVDLDDHYPDLPGSNPAHRYWIRNVPGLDPAPIDALAEGLKHADALTSPSKVILEDWAHIVPGFWVPNYTRAPWYAPLTQKPVGAADRIIRYDTTKEPPELTAEARPGSEGQVIIGWGGSISHVDSWIYSGIIEGLEMLFRKRPEARLKFCGHEHRLDYLFERFGDRVIRQDGVKPNHWPVVVSTFDIGVAPLDLRPLDPPWRPGAPVASYDERRSWLKAAEYLTAGVPWVASKSRTYADLAHMGTVVDNTPRAWFEALDAKVEYLARAKAEAWDRRRWALRKLTQEATVNPMVEVYNRIMAVKASAHRERLPGIMYVHEERVAA